METCPISFPLSVAVRCKIIIIFFSKVDANLSFFEKDCVTNEDRSECGQIRECWHY